MVTWDFEIVRAESDADFAAAGALGVQLVRFHHSLDPSRFILVDGTEDDYAAILRKQAENEASILLVARRKSDRATLGYVYGECAEREVNGVKSTVAHLHEIYVDDAARNEGVGRALLAAFIAHMRSLGALRVVLLVASRNKSAQSLFSDAGFVVSMCEMTCDLT